jgi:uncharacterized protein YwgA
MDRLRKAVIITMLAQELRQQGSWCGETHIQKSIYLFQELFGTDLDFRFILYHHGPYSFDLTDELTSLRADGLLELEPQDPPYGPRLRPSDRAVRIQKLFKKTLNDYLPKIKFVAEKIGGRGVMDLERTATALYVKKELHTPSTSERIKRLRKLKPHISKELASQATQEVDNIFREAKAID